MIVVDASAVFELLLSTPRGTWVAKRITSRKESLHAPHLLDVEITQVLRRYEAMGKVTEEDARAAMSDLAGLGIERYGHDILLPRAWQLRKNVTAYDAVYLALAEALDAPLLTCDSKLASVPGCLAAVEVAS